MSSHRNPYSKYSKKKRQTEFQQKYNNSSQEYKDNIDAGVNWLWFFIFVIVMVGALIKIAITGENL
ncbi:MAG: hypothetical protein WCY06_09705 [Flavobacteriaceae bacterium]